MWDTARTTQRKHVLSQRDDVVGQPRSFARWIHSPHEPRVMGRDARRAVIRVTPLRLDAADRHHRFAADADRVAAQCKREYGGLGKAQFARSDEEDPLMQPVFREDLLNAAETHFEWQGDVIGEYERPGAGAAFAAVNRNEVDAAWPAT